MIVMIMENVPISVRGEISRWFIEPRTGVFIGNVTAMVRDKLWEKCCQECREGGVIQIWSTNTEQKYFVRVYGQTQREIINLDGLQLVRRKIRSDD